MVRAAREQLTANRIAATWCLVMVVAVKPCVAIQLTKIVREAARLKRDAITAHQKRAKRSGSNPGQAQRGARLERRCRGSPPYRDPLPDRGAHG